MSYKFIDEEDNSSKKNNSGKNNYLMQDTKQERNNKNLNYQAPYTSYQNETSYPDQSSHSSRYMQHEPEDINEEIFINSIQNILAFIGENPNREGLINTPRRVLDSFKELFSGYMYDPIELFEAQFASRPINNDLVLIKKIKYFSMCEHHMLPVAGFANIGYIPNKSILGLSKFARLVEIFARRLQVQERMTVQIAETIMRHLSPFGVAVHLTADHYCMIMRGVRATESSTETFHFLGDMAEEGQKNKFISLIR